MVKGSKMSLESRMKISKATKGRKQSAEHIAKRVASYTGFKHSEDSKKLSSDKRKKWWKDNPEARKNMSKVHKGKCYTEDHKKKLSDIHKKAMSLLSEEERKVKFGSPGEKHPLFGIGHTPETCKKMSVSRKTMLAEDITKHSRWKGGISFFPYPTGFNDNLKESIRNRDGRSCRWCCKTETKNKEEFNKRLSVHHIDYDKENLEHSNLISLCLTCHLATTNGDRNMWKQRLKAVQEEI